MRICLVGWERSAVSERRIVDGVKELCRMYGHQAALLVDNPEERRGIFWLNNDVVVSCDAMLVDIGPRSQLNKKMGYYYEIGSAFNAGKLILVHDTPKDIDTVTNPDEYVCDWATEARGPVDVYRYIRHRKLLRVMHESWRRKYGMKAPYPINEYVAFGSVRDCLCAIEWIERHNESAAQREVVRPYEARI